MDEGPCRNYASQKYFDRCRVCQLRFTSRSGIARHVRSVHQLQYHSRREYSELLETGQTLSDVLAELDLPVFQSSAAMDGADGYMQPVDTLYTPRPYGASSSTCRSLTVGSATSTAVTLVSASAHHSGRSIASSSTSTTPAAAGSAAAAAAAAAMDTSAPTSGSSGSQPITFGTPYPLIAVSPSPTPVVGFPLGLTADSLARWLYAHRELSVTEMARGIVGNSVPSGNAADEQQLRLLLEVGAAAERRIAFMICELQDILAGAPALQPELPRLVRALLEAALQRSQ